ncbi:cupin domain-containing protein [Rutstroemia sp. NJR-2017a BBW]|nr:cupin domain-containing protein [Rutstroemia sp. NJR-2017a BBW]
MAPETSASPPGRRRGGANRENQYIFDLGVRGRLAFPASKFARKTGVTIPDTGIRDEEGFEPMDDLFSPDKPESVRPAQSTNGKRRNATEDATISSEADMEMDENTAPDPTEVLNQRKRDARITMPIPRSKSPLKTNLQSPARRHPSVGVPSSPGRGESSDNETGPVRRKLDFSGDDAGSEAPSKASNGTSKGRGRPALGKLTNGTRLTPGRRSPSPVNQSEDEQTALEPEDSVNYIVPGEEDDVAVADAEDDAEPEEEEGEPEVEAESEPEQEPEPELPKNKTSKNKGKGKAVEEPEVPVAKRRGRKPKNAEAPAAKAAEEEEVSERPTKKARRSLDEAPAPKPRGRPGRPSNGTKTGSTTKANSKANSKANPKPKAKAKAQSRMAPIAEVDSPQVQRGPPIPRNNGLFILRRETPATGAGFQRTRSGRNSIKPLAFWKNERVEYDEDETAADGRTKILLPSIKEIVRAEEVERTKSTRSRGPKAKGKTRKRPREEEEDDDEVEEWETEPGRIEAEVQTWDPEDQVGEHADEKVEEIALSAAAIRTRDIPGASFKFAKTLTLPFFGSGMVDLEPGAVKKPKNSRKMQMVFFVFYGRVEVTVNGTPFRIGKGGMWQVPRVSRMTTTNQHGYSLRKDVNILKMMVSTLEANE